MQSNFSKGVIFARSAAALNATIGVLSKLLMSNGFTASSVAVIQTILGCLLLSVLLLFRKRPASTAKWAPAAICAFFGIFVLFHFETAAYQSYAAAGVVVLLRPLEAKGRLDTLKRLTQRLNEIMIYGVNSGNELRQSTQRHPGCFQETEKAEHGGSSTRRTARTNDCIANAGIKRTTRCLIEWQLHTMTRPANSPS